MTTCAALLDHPRDSLPPLNPAYTGDFDARLIFIITASPVLAGAVGEYYREIDESLSVVWLTSADRAFNRPELARAAWVILDDVGPSTDKDLKALQVGAPEAEIMLIAGGRPAEQRDHDEVFGMTSASPAAAGSSATRDQSCLLRFHA